MTLSKSHQHTLSKHHYLTLSKHHFLLCCALWLLVSCAHSTADSRRGFDRNTSSYSTQAADASKPTVLPKANGKVLQGKASYYGPGFHGKKMANGEVFDQHAMVCAHKTLPFGTRLRITHIETGKAVDVVVKDRGPYKGDRILDLSLGAARRIGLEKAGVANVRAEILSQP